MNRLTRAFSRLKPDWFSERKAILLLVVLVIGVAMAVGAQAQGIPGFGSAEVYGVNVISIIMGALGLVLSAIAWGLGKLIIAVIGLIIIPILGYNGFGSSNVVSIGWALVRDVVNMFVIVVLLIIAIQTMLGVGRVDWRQQLPMFFLAIVAVNFSKTITLFIIDVGQVIMFTFVNALTDIAAGNFIQLFQVDSFFNLTDSPAFQEAINDSGGYNAVGFLATSYLTVALLGMVLGVLLLMALVFIYRIVVLWVLIILSPIAFFARGVGNTLSIGNTYADWWKRLVGATALGPILTFFLWLALASASAGSIADSEGFNTQPSADAGAASGLYVEAFETDKLLSIFIAMVLLAVGLQAASAQAQALGGPAAQLISGKTGERLLKGAIAAPAAAGFAGARAAGRGAYRAGRAGAAELETRGGYLTKASDKLAQIAAPAAALGGPFGRLAAAPAFAAQKRAASFREEVLSKAKDRTQDYSETQRFAEYDSIRLQQPPGAGRYGERAILESKLATDKNEQKAYKGYLKSQLGLGDSDEDKAKLNSAYEKAIQQSLKNTEANKNELFADDEKGKANLFKARSRNLHLVEGDDKETKAQKIRDHIFDDDFKVSQLSAESVNDKDVQAALREKTMGSYTDAKTGERVDVSAWDYVKRGQSGTSADARDAAVAADRGSIGNFDRAKASDIPQRLKDGVMDVKSLKVENMTGDNGAEVAQGLVEAASQGVDLSGMAEDVRSTFVSQMPDPATITDPVRQTKVRQALFSATGDASHIGVGADGSIQSGQRVTVANTIKNNPKLVANMNAGIQAAKSAGASNAVTSEVANNINKDSLDAMVREFEAGSDDLKEDIQDALTSIKTALDVELAAAGADATKQMKEMERRVSRAQSLTS